MSSITRIDASQRNGRNIAIAIALIIAGMFGVLLISSSQAAAATLYVGGSGPGNYTTIVSAVIAASPGDTIFVFSGIYRENVSVSKTLTITGENPATTVLDDGSFNIVATWVNISGFALQGRGTQDGIRTWFADHARFANNAILGYRDGVHLNATRDVTLTGNAFTDCGLYINGQYGQLAHWNSHHIDPSNTVNGRPLIYIADAVGGVVPGGAGEVVLANATGVAVQGQDIRSGSVGVEIGFSSNVSVTTNSVVSNTRDGIAVYHSTGVTISANSVQTNAEGVLLWVSSNASVQGNGVASSQGDGIHAVVSSFVTIANNILVSNGGTAIEVEVSNGANVVANNTVSGSPLGIAGGDLVQGNMLTNNTNGIRGGSVVSGNTVTGSSGVGIENAETISGNMITGGGGGIRYYSNVGGLIAANTVARNTWGIDLHLAQGAVVDQNNVSSNGQSGIQSEFSASLTITGNTIAGNGFGPNGGAGMALTSTTSSLIYHNNILRNAVQARDDIGNRWDGGYPTGGNRWSDYTGVDNCSGVSQNVCPAPDGIGDTPYVFLPGRDNYPLMASWTPSPHMPSAPSNVQATAGDRRIALAWGPPADDGGSPITNYTIYRATGSGAESLLVRLGNQQSYLDWPLSNGQTYRYRISATNARGEGNLSNQVAAIPYTIPSAPRFLTATPTASAIGLSWSPPADDGGSPVVGYEVYRGTSSGSETPLRFVSGSTTFTDSGVVRGVTYFYALSATNAAGDGPRSTEATASLAAPGNVPPTCSVATPGTNAVVSGIYPITGTANDADGTVVRVEFRIDAGPRTNAIGTAAWHAEWDTRTVPNGFHIVRARSFDGSNYSTETAVNVTVDNPAPAVAPSTADGLLALGIGALATVAAVETILLARTYLRNQDKREGR